MTKESAKIDAPTATATAPDTGRTATFTGSSQPPRSQIPYTRHDPDGINTVRRHPGSDLSRTLATR